MGNILAYILLSFVAAGMASCDDDRLLVDASAGSGSVDMKLAISVPEHDKVISSRVADFAVQDLYLLVFDEQGTVISRPYYENLNIQNGNSEHYVTTRVPVGRAYIYGFANINSDAYGNLKSDLDAIRNREELMNLRVSIPPASRNLQRAGTTWLMTGTCTDNENVPYYTVREGMQDIKSIQLKRIDSEITFHFKAGTNCKLFKATNWYCVNAPAQSFLVEHKVGEDAGIYEGWDASDSEKDYFSTLPQIGNNTIFENTFTFYMPENRKIAKNSISGYHERELEPAPHECDENGKRQYVNAPDNATYVVVNGTFEGTTNASETDGLKGEQQVSATVTYIIHLGYINQKAGDFFCNRNTKYTYTVTVNGVDDIVVEVEQDKERAPGATGEVIFQSGSNIYRLDAHYETVLLKFSLDDLVSKYRKNTITDPKFLCVVSTPFSNMDGVDSAKDKAWVKVSRNMNADTGLQDYRNATLMTVDELLAELETAVASYIESEETSVPELFTKQGKQYVVTYTCFIDEFYYDEADLPVAKTALEDGGSNIWKSFANQPDRKMYLVCSTRNSTDEESSIVSAAYILSQRSIKTFYSTEPESGKVIAYGIETLNETGELSWGLQNDDAPSFKACSSIYGWENTQKLFNSRNWNSVVKSSSNGYKTVKDNEQIIKGKAYLKEALHTNYQKAYIACMQRNRNESKTDKIADEDIKWYLPSIGQCQAFYIGEAALADARLFDYPANSPIDSYLNEVHYASSTYDGTKQGSGDGQGNVNSFRVLWAEEGASTSTYNKSTEWGYKDVYSIHYRCVRNLGTVKEPYNNFFENNDHIITYSKLNDAAKDRSKVTNGELGVHDYKSGNNRYYEGGFEIYQGRMPGGSFKEVVNNEIYTGCQDIPVTDGGARWRVPNLRELTLMVLSKDECIGFNYIFARTRCPYSQRTGWRILGANIGMQAGDPSGQIRCVRDVN